MFVAYRLAASVPFYGWGDSYSELPINGKTLKEYQDEIFRKHNIRTVECQSINDIPLSNQGCIAFEENLFFSEAVIRYLLKKIKASKSSFQIYLKNNSFNKKFILPADNDLFNNKNKLIPLFFFKDSLTCKEFHPLEQKIFKSRSTLTAGLLKNPEYNLDQCEEIAGRITHPFHLLMICAAENMMRFAKSRKRIPRILEGLINKEGSFLFHFLLKKQNKISRKAKIHPSATIEGSIIEEGVSIGANAVVRFSHIQKNTTVEELCSIKFSVIGEGNYICHGNQTNLTVTGKDCFLIHGPYHFSIFGNNVTTMAVLNCDVKIDRSDVKFVSHTGLIDSKQALLGIAYGHRSKIGAGNIIAPGRLVPNDFEALPPDFILKNF